MASGSTSRGGSKDGVNVQVVLRCRPRNSAEGRSPDVVHCYESRREVVLHQNVAGKQSSRTFVFDKVFGPGANQAALYDQAVVPIVDEALQGFNCTIFAYGQTGTGKTYTMEGETSDNTGEDLPREAGVIPRAIKQIFDHLERSHVDSSVRVSFLEVYNEELTDLLDVDDATQQTARNKLKIMEDKTGVIVQGLEDCIVHNSVEIFQVLRRGSSKRVKAETLLNKQSSRSHSIFTITIHMKETTIDGEDVVKIGKLNLVDLAGSECISRSGAKDGRAREAGSINQSLLTLGRVINTLVEHSGHIPYRDSKLTRLLRDSLGGKTKTCIIATIAPSVTCHEETLSTLDYAYRAKNIRNRPEVNQKISKTTMIRELTVEIENLKEELLAQRTKNGVFVPLERYKETEMQHSITAQRLDHMDAEIEAKAMEMQDLREQFRKKELEQADRLAALEKEKLQLEVELRETKERLEEECFVNTELRKGETALVGHSVALTDDIHRWAQESTVLFAKLDRFATMDSANQAQAQELKVLLTERLSSMSSNTGQMLESHKQRSIDLAKCLRDLAGRRLVNAEGLKKKLVEIQTAEDTMQSTFGSTVNKLHLVGSSTAQTMVASADACAKDAEAALEDGLQKCASAHDHFDGTLASHGAVVQELAASQKLQVDNIVDVTRNSHSEVRLRLSGVKRSAAEIRATVEHSIDENRTVLDSLARRYQESMARTGRELAQDLNNKINQLVSSFSTTVREAMNVTQDQVAAKQRKGMDACDVHCNGVEALGLEIQEHGARLEGEARTYFDGLPKAAAMILGGMNVCAETGRQLHASSQEAFREGLSVVKSHAASVKDAMVQGQGQAAALLEQANERSALCEKQLENLRAECKVDIERDLKAGQQRLSQADGDIQTGHQLVHDFGVLQSASARDLIQGAGAVLEEKMQWDDGTPELPERRDAAGLPSKALAYQLQVPPREALCEARRTSGKDAGAPGNDAPPKFTMGQVPTKGVTAIPLKQCQGKAPASSARPQSPVKEAPAKIQLVRGSRLPLRRKAACLTQDLPGLPTMVSDRRQRSKIPKIAEPAYVNKGGDCAENDAPVSERAEG
eukprot:evm.model.scf_1298.6 EVM.evm.TU.scf_1298.6   scf_1298:39133-44092(-)